MVTGGYPLQVADTRPSRSPGLPLSLQLLLKQLGWQNHLVCDQRGRRQALPGDLGKAPLISPKLGNFPVRTPGAPWGRRDRPEGVGTDTSWEWQEGLETYQERGLLRLRTGRGGSPYGSLFPLLPYSVPLLPSGVCDSECARPIRGYSVIIIKMSAISYWEQALKVYYSHLIHMAI